MFEMFDTSFNFKHHNISCKIIWPNLAKQVVMEYILPNKIFLWPSHKKVHFNIAAFKSSQNRSVCQKYKEKKLSNNINKNVNIF